MVAIPLYCKSLGFQFETKLCIFQNISKYFIEKIPHVLPNAQYGDNQTDITKMLNVGDDPAEWDFGRVPPPTPHLRPHFRNLCLSGAGPCEGSSPIFETQPLAVERNAVRQDCAGRSFHFAVRRRRRTHTSLGELQSSARGRRRTARLCESHFLNYFSYVTFCADKR